MRIFLEFVLLCAIAFSCCEGHGRLIEPPSRASAWRYGFPTPPDYNDHELYCGGFTRQWKINGGKCGECGDAWDLPQPRPHEFGGQWGQGLIVRKYEPGETMLIRIELTASHMGYFEFKVCPEAKAKQECLDRHLLEIIGGAPIQPAPNDLPTRFYPRNGSRIYEIKTILPDMKCAHCVLQWRYVAGNNWGICDDGIGAVGCGPQEEFRSCSDIAIGVNISKPMRPMRPTVRTTISTKTSTDIIQTDEVDQPKSYDYVFVLVALLVLFVVLCCLCMWYLHRYHDKRLKQWFESITHRFRQRQTNMSTTPKKESVAENASKVAVLPPVPPPRTRRQSRVKEMSADESSIA